MKSWRECCDNFNVGTERGLSQDQVKKNLEKFGPNGECTLISIAISPDSESHPPTSSCCTLLPISTPSHTCEKS